MTTRPQTPDRHSQRLRQRGLSLVEVLVSLGVMALVALFSLPPLMTALAIVNRGAEASESVHLVTSEAELLSRMPSDLPPLDLDVGALKNQSTWYAMLDSDEWVAEIPAEGILRWTMVVDVSQHSVADLQPDGSGLSTLDTPLPGGAASNFVQLKVIDLDITGARIGGPLGAGQTFRFRIIREP